jgi:cardiolipin synthase (CMP-forming)
VAKIMNTASSTPLPARPLALANLLTYGRIAAVPVVVALMYWHSILDGGLWLRWVALAVFITAGITDVLDGYVARAYGQQSSLGRMLDPIADKLLVGTTLIMLTHNNTIDGWHIWAAVVIMCREILVSGLREFLAGLNVQVHVTQLAKCKTMVQMVALAVLLAGPAGDVVFPGVTATGLALLWLAALLTLWTGYDYLKAAVLHAMER